MEFCPLRAETFEIKAASAVLVLGVPFEGAGEVAGEARVAEDLDVALLRLLDDLGHLALQRLAREGRVGVLEPGHRVEVAEAPMGTSKQSDFDAIDQTQPGYVCKLVPFTTASSSQYVPNDDSFSFAAVVA